MEDYIPFIVAILKCPIVYFTRMFSKEIKLLVGWAFMILRLENELGSSIFFCKILLSPLVHFSAQVIWAYRAKHDIVVRVYVCVSVNIDL